MPPKTQILQQMIASQTFRFGPLEIADIDNSPVLRINSPEMAEQETCLFHKAIADGNQYFDLLKERIAQGVANRRATPVVRFADGEYAFYEKNLHCNGLYQQAESLSAIQEAIPAHIEALRFLAASGVLAPLIFPGNVRPPRKRSFFSFWKRSQADPSALKFLDFLGAHHLELTRDNYVPFYVVYAYLTSEAFVGLVDGKQVCLVVSEFQMDPCQRWFARFSGRPALSFVPIPDSYVATRWPSLKDSILGKIPENTDLCLVGAGVGALPACVEIAKRFSIPAIDAGHVLNLMNDREDKSGGPRLYTLRKTSKF